MSKALEALTDGNEFAERARFNKASKVAGLVTEHYGPNAIPTNEACRTVAALLAQRGELSARPLSDRSCELVRAILAVRGEITHGLGALLTDAEVNEGRALLEGM